MPVFLLGLVPIVISVAGRTFVTMAAKKVAKGLIKKGFKKLTKKNFKKSYEFFRGDKLLNLADKNKVLKKELFGFLLQHLMRLCILSWGCYQSNMKYTRDKFDIFIKY